jgi:signal transduction histidine kinase
LWISVAGSSSVNPDVGGVNLCVTFVDNGTGFDDEQVWLLK